MGSLGKAGSGAVKGAAVGSVAGPYGAAIGGAIGGLYGLFSSDDHSGDAAAAANAEHIANGRRNAIALENYRQAARSQYHNLLTAQTTPYQDYSNNLAAMTGGHGMSTAGLSANENPLSLQATGIGAPEGSNYAGWDESGVQPNGQIYDHHGVTPRPIRNVGIGEQIANPGLQSHLANRNAPDQAGRIQISLVDSPDLAAMRDPRNNTNYNPASVGAPPQPGATTGAGFQFMPRRAP